MRGRRRPFRTQAQAPDGFRYVSATPEEVAQYRRDHNGWNPSVYRVQCLACNKRMWGSGLGLGSHRRACKGKPAEGGATLS